MKLYLFGGAEIKDESYLILKNLINQVLSIINPKQLLHVPYARIEIPKGEEEIWGEGWVKKDLYLKGIELLDARNSKDLVKANNPVIFMNGGPQRDLLYEKITSNKLLLDLVMNANNIIGESSGAMIVGEYRPTYKRGQAIITQGLNILKNTIIEAHYTQRDNHQALRDEMKESGVKYGIGIDSATGIIIDTKNYPDKYEVVGDGLVELIKLEDLKHK